MYSSEMTKAQRREVLRAALAEKQQAWEKATAESHRLLLEVAELNDILVEGNY